MCEEMPIKNLNQFSIWISHNCKCISICIRLYRHLSHFPDSFLRHFFFAACFPAVFQIFYLLFSISLELSTRVFSLIFKMYCNRESRSPACVYRGIRNSTEPRPRPCLLESYSLQMFLPNFAMARKVFCSCALQRDLRPVCTINS